MGAAASTAVALRKVRVMLIGSLSRQVVPQHLRMFPWRASIGVPRGVGQSLGDVVAFQIRVRGQHVLRVVVRGQQTHGGPNRDAKAPNARASSHDVWILRDSIQPAHGIESRAAWGRGDRRRDGGPMLRRRARRRERWGDRDRLDPASAGANSPANFWCPSGSRWVQTCPF